MITYNMLDNLDDLFYFVKMQNSPPLPLDHRTATPVSSMTPSPMDSHPSSPPNHPLSPHPMSPHSHNPLSPHPLTSSTSQLNAQTTQAGLPPLSDHGLVSQQRPPLPMRVGTPSQSELNLSQGQVVQGMNLQTVASLSGQLMTSPGGEAGKERCFVCPKCYKGFRSKQQLAQHHLVHSNERKHQCNYCDKAFKQLSHLQQHTRIHTGEKPYRCTMEECDRAFAQLSNLQHHLRNHDSQVQKAANRPHKCAICHRGYSTDSALKNHTMRMHIHIKPLEPRPINPTPKVRRPRKKKNDIFDGPSMVPRLQCLSDTKSIFEPNGLGFSSSSHLLGTTKDGGLSSLEAHNHNLVSSFGMSMSTHTRPGTAESALNYSKDVIGSRPLSTGSLGELERTFSTSQSQSHTTSQPLDSRHTPAPDDRQTMASPLGSSHMMQHLSNRQSASQGGLSVDQVVTSAGYRPYLTTSQFSSHHLPNTLSIPANADLSALANHMIRAAHQSGSIPPSLHQFMPLGGH